MISVGQIPENFSITDVFELELDALPTALVGRRALYTELIWDAEGGFQQEWIDGSSVEIHEDDTVTFLLKRRAFSAAGLSLFTVGAGGGSGSTELDGNVTGPSDANVVVAIQNLPVQLDGEPDVGEVLTVTMAGPSKVLSFQPQEGGGDTDTIDNVSTVPGGTLTEALDYLEANLGGGDTTLDGVNADLSGFVEGQVLGFVGGEIVPVDQSGGTGASWTIEVDENLTTTANQTFADGTQTWLGKTWTGLNIAGNVDSFGAVNGTGVVLDHNGASSDWYLSVNTAPRLYLACNQLPSFLLGRSKIRVWMHEEGTGIDANYENAKFGLETIPYVSNARRLWAWNLTQAGLLGAGMLNNSADVSISNAASPSTARIGLIELDTATLEARFYSKVATTSPSDPNADEFDIDTMTFVGSWRETSATLVSLDGARSFAAATAANLCVVFGLQTVNSSNTAVATWKRLRVETYTPR